MKTLRNPRGFTLTEMMVVMTIVGISFALGAPPLLKTLRRSDVDRVPVQLQSDVRLAISSARTSGRTVLVDFDTAGYVVRDAGDSTQFWARDFSGVASINAERDMLVFPWGLVQPLQVDISGYHYNRSFQILPT